MAETTRDRIVAYLRERRAGTLRQISTALNLRRQTVSGSLSSMKDDCLVQTQPEKVNGMFVWELYREKPKVERWHGIPAGPCLYRQFAHWGKRG